MIESSAGARGGGRRLGLPSRIRACLFDLDGVLTQTRKLHAEAWKQMFDAFLRARAARTGARFVPFDLDADYAEYVDGKPRAEGVRSFLAARGIELPDGRRDDPPTETISGLGNRKNELVLASIRGEVSRRIRARCATCGPSERPGSPAPSSRRARTPARCWRRPGSRTSSTRGSTGLTPSAASEG